MTSSALSDQLTVMVHSRGRRGFHFRDLVAPAAYHGATFGELAEWMAQARALGLIETFASETLPPAPGQRFRVVVAPKFASPVPVNPSAVEPQ
jgi:hypothetical protein